ncbi:MAG TPA: 2,3-dehydroadipyl-CoA hydratase, partial [Pseudomonas sp.]|nr:2,3-dehydroadipyl-CoA hydratase [Pseudomonas sp.]
MPHTLEVQAHQATCLITLHRPQALNALTTELLAELAAELQRCAA